MIQKLKTLFPSLIELKAHSETISQHVVWFLTPDNEIVGIPACDLSKRDRQWLETLLIPYEPGLPAMTCEETYWNHLINTTSDAGETTVHQTSYRFIYFQVQLNQIHPEAFKEAIDELFGRQMPVLWVNNHSGLLIETPVARGDEAISYNQIIDVLMSDLYVNINFFVGPIMTDHSKAAQLYNMLTSNADDVFQSAEQSVVSYIEAIPFILIDKMDVNERSPLIQIILGEFSDDADMLKTIETFILCNLNVSTTAKQLYMHRNSLQYRLDKFTEKTGIDIRQFTQSMSVLLAIGAIKLNKS